MALGASALAKKKAIVSRLTAVEEIAGMEILCSDKTGFLNHLCSHLLLNIFSSQINASHFKINKSLGGGGWLFFHITSGTLTKNELTVKDPIAYVGELDHVIFDAALASKPVFDPLLSNKQDLKSLFFWGCQLY